MRRPTPRIPPALRHHLRVRDDVLTVDLQAPVDWRQEGTVLALIAAMALGVVGMSALVLPSELAIVFAILILGVLTLGSLALLVVGTHLRRSLRLSVVTGSYRAGTGPWVRPQTLVLEGEPGEEIRLLSDAGLLFSRRPDLDGLWDPDRLCWLAQTIADQLQIPLSERVDRNAWTRWRVDPTHRATVRFRRRIRASSRSFPTWYETHAREPAKLLHPPEGFELDGVLLERRGIRTRQVGIAWSDVQATEIEIRNVRWGDDLVKRVTLLVLTRRGLLALFERPADGTTTAELIWMRDRIREHLGRRLDLGTSEDVPAELRAVRQRMTS